MPDGRLLRLVVLVKGVGAAQPAQVHAAAEREVPEVGVLAAVTDVLLVKAPELSPGDIGSRERQRPEERPVLRRDGRARRWGGPGRVRRPEQFRGWDDAGI